MVFTRSFYKSLLYGQTVPESFDSALEELRNSPSVAKCDVESEKFILLRKDFATNGPNTPPPTYESIFADCHHLVSWPSCPEHCTIGSKKRSLGVHRQFIRLPTMEEVFEGREVDMHQLIKNIRDRRLVVLTGPKVRALSLLRLPLSMLWHDL